MNALAVGDLSRFDEAVAHALQFSRLSEFARAFWTIAQPGREVVWGPYLEAMCDEVQRAMEEPGVPLVLMTPPRCGKSTVVNVLAPAWRWLHRPNAQTLNVSSSARLATRDSLKTRDLIAHPRYQRLAAAAGVSVTLHGSQREKVEYQTTVGGRRECIGVESRATGKGCDDLFLDDLVDAQEATIGSPERIRERMAEVWSKLTDTWASRFNPSANGARGTLICVGQSLHPDDPPHMLARHWGARVVCLPMEYDPAHPHRYSGDWRTEPGELLCPDLRSREWCDEERRRIGERTWSTQYQQRPRIAEGGPMKRALFCEYREPPEERARSCGDLVITVDPAGIEEHVGQDSTVVQVWGRTGEFLFLLDEARGRWGITEAFRQFRAVCDRWPKARHRVIEATVNGLALIRRCEEAGVAVRKAHTQGRDKFTRAADLIAAVEAGRVYLPSPSVAPWVVDWLDEVSGFHAGAEHDDRVDAAAWAAAHFASHNAGAAVVRLNVRGL